MAEDQEMGENVEVEDEAPEVEDTEDGGAIVRLQDNRDLQRHKEHFANIVDDVDQGDLTGIVNDLLDKIEKDKDAREKRDKLYEEGLRRTGLGDDAPGGAQFTGANKVVHPMLVEACVDFSARVMKELFPPSGPVKTKILGEVEKEKLEKADRKRDWMNWQLTEQMPEFRGELEQLTTQLPLGGVQYLKLAWNPNWERPYSEFIPVDDVYLPFAATNFYTAERRTHVQYITAMEYQRRVKMGMYIDVDLANPDEPEFSKSSKANDKIEGRQETSYNEDGLRTIFEISTFLTFDDGIEPYIISIDKTTRKPLSLYRNWEPDDDRKEELEWMIEFPFVPWRGAYPIGLTHMIGGLSGAATGALRALLDSAHIQNIPTMLKLKGGPNGQTINVQPTEVVEIEGGINIDDVRKIAMPLPFNPPSAVLFQLLGWLTDAGARVIQTSFEKLSDQNPNQPVGTTMALIEQGMTVFSSIHSRLHSSMARVLKVLHRINSAYLTQEIIDAAGEDLDIQPSDFDGQMDIIPVSDPHIFSDTQRFAQTQAIMQRAAMMPQMYDARKVEEMFLHQMKAPEDLLVPKPGEDDRDPVSENVAAAMGQPVYVLPKQDHLAHLKIHLGFTMSPLFGQNPAIAKTALMPLVQHLRDHLLNYYLVEAHNGVDMGVKRGLIQQEGNQEALVISQVQQVVEQELGMLAQLLPQLDEMAQKFAPPPMPQDSSMQVAQLNAQVQQKALDQRAQIDQARIQLDQQKLQQTSQQAQTKIQQDAAEKERRMQFEMAKLAQDTQRGYADMQTRERMNTADNETAKELAAAEIASGEKVAVSTGTGINPNP